MRHNCTALILGLEDGTFVCLAEAGHYSEQKYAVITVDSVRLGNAVFSNDRGYTYDGVENRKISKNVSEEVQAYIRYRYDSYTAEELFIRQGIDKALEELIFNPYGEFDASAAPFASEIRDYLQKKRIPPTNIVKYFLVDYAACVLANDDESNGSSAPDSWKEITAESDAAAWAEKLHTDEASVALFKKFIDAPYYSNSIFFAVTERSVFTGKAQTHAFLYGAEADAAIIPDAGALAGKFDRLFPFFQSRIPAEGERPEDALRIKDGVLVKYAGHGREAEVPSGVHTIGEDSFRNCYSLKRVILPEGVTRIEKNAFSGCVLLEEIILPSSLVEIDESAFAYCGIKKIVLPDNVARLGKCCFFKCKSLSEIVLSVSLQSLACDTFGFCWSLQKIAIPQGICTIEANAFSESQLKSAQFREIAGWCSFSNAASPQERLSAGIMAEPETAAGILLRRGKTLVRDTNVRTEIPSLPEGTAEIGEKYFAGCIYLTEYEIPTGVESVGDYAFADCIHLKKIVIPETVTRIGANAFDGCCGLIKICLPNSIKSIGNNVFRGCLSLEEVFLPKGLSAIPSGAFYNCKALRGIELPVSVVRIEEKAYCRCGGLRKVTIPDGTEEIAYGAFDDCAALEDISLPDGLKKLDCGFNGCASLFTLSVPPQVELRNYVNSGDTPSVIRRIIFREGRKSVGMIPFKTVEEVVFSAGLQRIEGHAFSMQRHLKKVEFPDGLEEIGQGAFGDCETLEKAILPDTVVSIGSAAFSGCKNLKELSLSKRLKQIPDCAFWGCRSLCCVDLPEELQTIGKDAFFGCRMLENITIPASVRIIGDGAFDGCERLHDVILSDGVVEVGDSSFGWKNEALKDGYIPMSTRKSMAAKFILDACRYADVEVFKSKLTDSTEHIEAVSKYCELLQKADDIDGKYKPANSIEGLCSLLQWLDGMTVQCLAENVRNIALILDKIKPQYLSARADLLQMSVNGWIGQKKYDALNRKLDSFRLLCWPTAVKVLKKYGYDYTWFRIPRRFYDSEGKEWKPFAISQNEWKALVSLYPKTFAEMPQFVLFLLAKKYVDVLAAVKKRGWLTQDVLAAAEVRADQTQKALLSSIL